MSPPPRLVASDVDGTLVGADVRPTARTRAAVAAVVSAGVPFVLVTGRPPRWVPEVARQFPGVRWAVCANGAVRYDVTADRVVSSATLAPATLRGLDAACAAVLPEARLGVERVGRGAFDAPGDRSGSGFESEPDYLHPWAGLDHPVRPRAELLDRPAVKLLVRHPGMTSEAMLAALAPALGAAVTGTFSHPKGLVELAPAGVTKATGLAELAAALGVSAPAVLAFGDMPNDTAMLVWAGHGVALGDAHPQVRAAADEVTAPLAEDGVARVLERWF